MLDAARSRDRSRPYDIVIWGATGFTGQLVAEYLVRTRSDGDLRLALAGRNRAKLEALRDQLTEIDPAAAELPLEVADSFDTASLDALATKAEVICTTVGPYGRYGAALVEACVRHQTDYCDLTGETPFVRAMVDAHHDQAHRNGSRIVCCCGFDSIPSDLGALMMQQAMQERHGVNATQVKLAMVDAKGGPSGGTTQTMLDMVEQMRRTPSLRKLMADPYSLNPEGERDGPDGPDRRGVAYDPDFEAWTGPFIMAAINTRVVRRSNALLDYAWGRDFRYDELVATREGVSGWMQASAMVTMLASFMLLVTLRPTRALLTRFVLHSPGEGPSKEEQEAGFYKFALVARGRTDDGQEHVLRGRIEGDKDPGYRGTAILLGESARCLAVDGATLGTPGGVLTPASAMGPELLERLRGAGVVFAVD